MKRGKFKNYRLIDGRLYYAPRGVATEVSESVTTDDGDLRADMGRVRRRFRNEVKVIPEIHATIYEREPGSILHKLEQRRVSLVSNDKSPLTAAKHIGVEIEFLSGESVKEIKLAFVKAGLAQYVTYHSDGSVRGDSADCPGDHDCSCEHEGGAACDSGDCSCLDHCECSYCDGECQAGDDRGHELCVLATESEIESVIEKVCSVLNDRLDASVNQTCGLHVHLDQRRRVASKAYSRLVKALPLLASVVPSSRLENQYCALNRDADSMRVTGRYWAINPKSLEKHRTLEVRLHSGTTDPVKIISWIRLLRHICARKSSAPIQSFKQLITEGLPTETAFYLMQRFQKFGARRSSGWKPLEVAAMASQSINESEAA
jgi:hypothetical protein